jgi:transcriptional regulator with XRE-family HTH domain
VTAEEIRALRRALRCTPTELAEALGVSRQLVMQWEEEERFPTKRHVGMMEALRTKGRGAVPRIRGRRDAEHDPMKVLADPELWRLVRKLLAHPELRTRVLALAKSYDDPV